MKTIYNFVAFVFLLLVALLVLCNVSNTISLETSFISLKANVGFLILSCSILSSIATILLLLSFSKSNKNKIKQLENTKLNYEIESNKVKQLEAKVKTLEEALKIATGRQ